MPDIRLAIKGLHGQGIQVGQGTPGGVGQVVTGREVHGGRRGHIAEGCAEDLVARRVLVLTQIPGREVHRGLGLVDGTVGAGEPSHALHAGVGVAHPEEGDAQRVHARILKGAQLPGVEAVHSPLLLDHVAGSVQHLVPLGAEGLGQAPVLSPGEQEGGHEVGPGGVRCIGAEVEGSTLL